VAGLWPRLLGIEAAARYCGVSTWTIRGWLSSGTLTRVTLPGKGGGSLDRLLVDRCDLDLLIHNGKAR